MNATTNLKEKILTRIRTRRRGGVYINKDFLDLGNRAAVDQALCRLVKAGAIGRIGRGLFAYRGGTRGTGSQADPDLSRVAQALARRRGGRAEPCGSVAARSLGIEATVPAKGLFVTDGWAATVRLDERTLILRRASPGALRGRGSGVRMVMQALDYLGKSGVTEDVIAQLQATLSERDKAKLLRESRYAAGWITEAARSLSEYSKRNATSTCRQTSCGFRA